MSLLSDIIEIGVGLAARALRLKRVVLPPKLQGPVHVYPTDPLDRQWRYCTKCGLFNARRAAYTVPPCSEQLPSVIVELP